MVLKVNITEVVPNDFNPNRQTDQEYRDLVESIRQTGPEYLEKDPILVRPVDSNYEIVDGEHRWKACVELGFKEIYVEVEELSRDEAQRRCVIRNKDRGNLWYYILSKNLNEDWERYKHGGMTQEKLGKLYGFSRDLIAKVLPVYPRLEKMCEHVHTFSNRDLVYLASVGNDIFREALIKHAKDKPSLWIQAKATLCNAIAKYIMDKGGTDEDFTAIIPILMTQEDEAVVRNAVDALLGKPICYIPNVLQGDAFETLEDMKSGSVSLVVTSPPYGTLKDYEVKGQLTAHKSYRQYLERLSQVWGECKRVLHEGGRICINIGDQFLPTKIPHLHTVRPIQADIIKQGQELELDYMGSIVWHKVKKREASGGGAVIGSYPYPPEVLIDYDHEYILIFRKPGRYPEIQPHLKAASKIEPAEWNKLTNSSSWNFPGERQTIHPAPFPLELPTRLIKMFSFSGDTILDPFVGSGTTLLAAMPLGRRSIGIDLVPKFVDVTHKRIEEFKEEHKDDFRYTETS